MLSLLWQLPQLVLGYVLVLVLRGRRTGRYRGTIVFTVPIGRAAASFGPIILTGRANVGERLLRHEYGHSRQSLLLGPLYLPLVGVPSLTFAALTRLGLLRRESYFRRYPESWADRLGGVHDSTSNT
ncbi:MAG: hypothetical protein ACLFM6_04265 [Spirochaetaceae bacterium]